MKINLSPRKSFLGDLLIGSIFAFVMAGCSDTINQQGENVLGEDSNDLSESVYITFSVKLTDNYSINSRGDEDTENRFDSDNPDTGDLFNKGLEIEQMISSDSEAHHRIIFFKEDKFLTHKPLMEIPNYLKDEESDGLNETSKVWQSYTSAKCHEPLAQLAGLDDITVFVILNPNDNLISQLNTLTVGDGYEKVKKLFQAQITGSNKYNEETEEDNYDKTTDYLFYEGKNGKKYFTMTSSMVVPEGEVRPSVLAYDDNDELQLLPGTAVKFWPTLEQALQHPLTIYAERMQAKYTLSFTPDLSPKTTYYLNKENNLIFSKNEFPGMTARLNICTKYDIPEKRSNTINAKIELKDWKVNIVGWGVNATEKGEYLFKNLAPNINYYEGWNGYSDNKIRNFWAEDKNYYMDTYPDQYRDAWDETDVIPTQGSKNILNYFCFNQFKQREIHHYSAENTWNFSILNSKPKEAIEDRKHLRCGTHLIVAAQLLIDGMDDGFENPQVGADGMVASGMEDKYYMNNIFWTKNAFMNYAIEHLGYMLESDVPRYKYVPVKEKITPEDLSPKKVFNPKEVDGNIGTRFYVRNGNTFVAAKATDFEIKPLNIKGGDGWVYVCPKLDESHPGMTVLYVLQEDGATDYQVSDGENFYSQISLDDYNGLAYTYTTYMARHFNNGCMYYPVSVLHNGNSENIYSEQPTLKTGDIGVVRNHWYHIDIIDISTPGCPVDNLNQPIIPNNEPEFLGLQLHVNIIPWHYIIQEVYF